MYQMLAYQRLTDVPNPSTVEWMKGQLDSVLERLAQCDKDVKKLKKELDKAEKERDEFKRSMEDMRSRLKSSTEHGNALDRDLELSRNVTGDLRSQIEELEEELDSSRTDLVRARTGFDNQVEVNKELNKQVEKLSEAHVESSAELASLKDRLHGLHKATLRLRKYRKGRGD